MIDKDKIIESFDENYEAGKGILHGFRRFINDLMLKGKNIDRLMTDKVEDYVLVQELPIGFKVGKRTVYVGNFPFKNEHKFFKKWAMIISNLNSQILNWELSEERRKELLDQASFHLLGNDKYMLEFLLMNK